MSNPNIRDILTSPRAQAELERIKTILADRNQQLHATEQQLNNAHINHKQTQMILRLLVVFCVLLIVVLSLGGAA